MKMTRCEEVIVQFVVRTYDGSGRPLTERLIGRPNASGGLDPLTVFRNGETEDFWAYVEKIVTASRAKLMNTTRCEEVIVHFVTRTYDEKGRPVSESVLGRPTPGGGIEPIKVFRNGETEDFWGYVDKMVEAVPPPKT